MRKRRPLLLLIFFWIFGITTLCTVMVSASNADISHSYKTNDSIPNGSIVSLDGSLPNYVDLANTNNESRLIGVAVARNSSLLVVDPNTSQLQVATSGSANALVSTINGSVSVGDQISTSPFNGVGMKALPGSRIIGISQSSLSSSTKNTLTQTVTDKAGNKTQIEVGYVRVSIAIGSETASSSGLNAIEKFIESLTGHSVSAIRIFLSGIVAIFALVALSVLIYATVHSSIIAIGRNPLARWSIFKTLGSALAMAGVTAALASLVIFVLLR